MTKASKSTANIQDIGIGTVHEQVAEGYEFAFLSLRERGELAPFLKGLPDDHCDCPHWGYVIGGKVTFTHVDGRNEVFETGDAFFVSPGHVPVIEAGTDVLFISPEADAARVNTVMQSNMAAMQSS